MCYKCRYKDEANKSFTNRISQVRYEDLKDNPEKEIKKMFKFADIYTSPASETERNIW